MFRTTVRIIIFSTPLVFITCIGVESFAGRGGGGGGRGGGGRSGGGVSRPSPSISRSPSMSRPSAPTARPSPAIASRPSGAAQRPSTGNIGGARPATGAKPSTGSISGSRTGQSGIAGSRPGTGVTPGTRPSAGQLNDFLEGRPAAGATRPSTTPSNRPGAIPGRGAIAEGGAAADFLRGYDSRPATPPATGARAGIADRAAAGDRSMGDRAIGDRAIGDRMVADRSLADNRAGRIENRQQYQDNRMSRRDEVREQVQENHPVLDFWSDNPGWAALRISRPYRWATWGALSGWCGGYGWSEPMPYSYGENVYYQDEQVYYGDKAVATAEEYAIQAQTMIENAPEVVPEQSEWMPLGVFALTQDGQKSGPSPTLFLQLAISKEGVIAGTLRNSATATTQDIEGVADKESQRVAWNVKGKARPIMETGVVNLTQDTSPALVHFADGQTQQWLMVRLEEPAIPKSE